MKPLRDMRSEDARSITFLLTDIDDTLTTDGKLPANAYQALWDLSGAGVGVIAVTGRPAGWCDLISRQWPVAAVIGENGAFAMLMDGELQRTLPHPDAPEPMSNAARLRSIAEEVYAEVPGTRPAKDQFSRRYDVAIDFREEPPLLTLEDAERVRRRFENHGAHAKVSSIHVNAWFGSYDKYSMAELLMRERFGLRLDSGIDNRRCAYCGDSPNDEPMFRRFANSIGVANIRQFSETLRYPPAYVTDASSADGFAELAGTLLAARS